MDKKSIFNRKEHLTSLLFIFLIIGYSTNMQAFTFFQDSENYNAYKGKVVDVNSNKPLVSATISVDQTNISTVTNDEGAFLLKVPKSITNGTITVSYLGYRDKKINLSEYPNEELKIGLSLSVTELSEVNIDPRDPEALIRAVMSKKGENYLSDHTIMTAFYRETIKKRRKYVSLSEAVVDVYKNPYESRKTDILKLYKARKSADYKKLDTLAVKLQGGPTSTLYIDLMKNPENVFTQDMLGFYQFSFDKSTKIHDRYIYVLNFKQRPTIPEPLYHGKLYIDAGTLALTKAVFSLNTEDKNEVSKMFVKKKPTNAKVYITQARYDIDYRQKDGKWYYGYGRIDLAVKINWKKKLFNSNYKLNVEMAVTDWKKNVDNLTLKPKERLKSSVVLSDQASGFSDPKFWGEYNVIEPEKSIESAIKKIQKQLRKLN
ncbi:carboxypeptidase-like regulatory domain-containing protein [Aquimarina sp. 2201CG5-10]|uniref:carboxypeptidase-like regulatory domain-containing protein n=1 Tax=Aquimarina callyspongiae TaxID=3098150 RepID=UPI002AB45FA5|nr:carboxypeptidase-like regulatory domain-containing protein [Aquimarina sp. 2201CG5-10]MDY8138162.1 carboxypeptidase-like regulatory domain-containing protein [Aquimarina sp. 2201CG5-10]